MDYVALGAHRGGQRRPTDLPTNTPALSARHTVYRDFGRRSAHDRLRARRVAASARADSRLAGPNRDGRALRAASSLHWTRADTHSIHTVKSTTSAARISCFRHLTAREISFLSASWGGGTTVQQQAASRYPGIVLNREHNPLPSITAPSSPSQTPPIPTRPGSAVATAAARGPAAGQPPAPPADRSPPPGRPRRRPRPPPPAPHAAPPTHCPAAPDTPPHAPTCRPTPHREAAPPQPPPLLSRQPRACGCRPQAAQAPATAPPGRHGWQTAPESRWAAAAAPPAPPAPPLPPPPAPRVRAAAPPRARVPPAAPT